MGRIRLTTRLEGRLRPPPPAALKRALTLLAVHELVPESPEKDAAFQTLLEQASRIIDAAIRRQARPPAQKSTRKPSKRKTPTR